MGWGASLTDNKQKTIGQAGLQLNAIMKPLRLYGQAEYCDVAISLIKELMGQVYDRAQGKDVMIVIDERRIKW